MKIIYKEPYKKLIDREIEDNSENHKDIIQDMIKGEYNHLCLPHNIKLLRNVHGKSLNLEPNIPWDRDLILGNVIFIGSDGDENFTSLSEIQEAYIRKNYYI